MALPLAPGALFNTEPLLCFCDFVFESSCVSVACIPIWKVAEEEEEEGERDGNTALEMSQSVC
jgi:hypothetical protein